MLLRVYESGSANANCVPNTIITGTEDAAAKLYVRTGPNRCHENSDMHYLCSTVLNDCLSQIRQSDVVIVTFCNDHDHYHDHYQCCSEAAYAHALGKPIVVITTTFSDDAQAGNYWFPIQMATESLSKIGGGHDMWKLPHLKEYGYDCTTYLHALWKMHGKYRPTARVAPTLIQQCQESTIRGLENKQQLMITKRDFEATKQDLENAKQIALR